MKQRRSRIGITSGDPCGIGPEIVVKALSYKETYRLCCPIIIGSYKVIQNSLQFSNILLKIHQISEAKESLGSFGTLDLIDIDNVDVANIDFNKIKIGEVSPFAGKASVEYIKLAVKLCLEGEIDAMVTAPINKTAMHKAGFNYPGHTELLAELTKSPKVAMMLAGRKLKVTFVTSHVALSEVPNLLSIECILDTIELTIKALKWMGIRCPKIAVAALNPHAGEAGAFGIEELEKITPAILRAKALGWQVDGPIPADSIFIQAQSGKWDAVVVMYHDQGNIPIKLLEFGNIVNVTLGLPIIRTSVDHGTAFDIAGKGLASESSLCAAIKFAVEMCRRRERDLGKRSEKGIGERTDEKGTGKENKKRD